MRNFVVFISLFFLICFQNYFQCKLSAQNIINDVVAKTILDSLIKYHYDCDVSDLALDSIENKMFYIYKNSNLKVSVNKHNCQIIGLNTSKSELLLETDSIALIISEIIVNHKFGRDKILKQKPFLLQSLPETWIVKGSLSKGVLGGVFLIEIQKKDCRVLQIIHEK